MYGIQTATQENLCSLGGDILPRGFFDGTLPSRTALLLNRDHRDYERLGISIFAIDTLLHAPSLGVAVYAVSERARS